MTIIEGAAVQAPDRTRDAWDALAAGYDEFVTPLHRWLASEALARAGLRAGMRFLDVAAGSGALALPAARLGARVSAVDLSPAMLERLAARARTEGLDIETRVMDGHALEIDDASYDVAGSQFGVMLFPDMPRGIREMVRVTRPGGRVLVTAFGEPQRVEFLAFLVRAVREVAPAFTGPPADPPPLPFQLQDPRRLAREMADAGLREVRVDTVDEAVAFESGDALWQALTNGNPIVRMLLAELRLSDAQLAVVRRTLADMVRERADGGAAAVLTNPVHVATGTR